MTRIACALVLVVACLQTQRPSVDARYERQATCDGLGDACVDGGRCCNGMSCGFDVSCCISGGQVCDDGSDCCSGACDQGVCTRSAAGGACGAQSDCQDDLECDPALAICYALPGSYCRTSNDCGSHACSDGTCQCGEALSLCTSGSDCCGGFVCADGLCRGSGPVACEADIDCYNGCCIDGTCSSCGGPIGSGCTSDGDCGPDTTCNWATGTCL